MCKIKYATGDLFSAPNQESLAHCVSEDLRMGKGIAVLFKKNFGRVTELKEQSEFFFFLKKREKLFTGGSSH
uniref:Macro domain-containing protein n=1 Tax=Poecilia latipinna TaxID=48699 RepID=A0A3B3W0V5_9TELE